MVQAVQHTLPSSEAVRERIRSRRMVHPFNPDAVSLRLSVEDTTRIHP